LDSNTKFSIEISLGTTLNHYFFLKRIRILKFLAEELNKLYRNSANGMLTLQRLFFFLLAIVIHPRIRLSAFGDGAGTRCGSGFLVLDSGPLPPPPSPLDGAPIKMETNEVGRNEVLR